MTLMAFPAAPSNGDTFGKWVYDATSGSWVLNEGAITLAQSTTDDLAEGVGNLYYTDARADARINGFLIDEDGMGTNSATRLPTQQSVKAYVDTVTGQLGVANFLGSAVVTEAEGLASSDNDTSIPTTAAVIDYVNATGDINGVTAGTGLTGGGTSGTVTLNVSGLTTAQLAAATLVTQAEGIASNDNETTLPTSAAVKDYADNAVATGNAATVTNGVYTSGNQTIAGTKTFSNTISGSINGNAATVTNGVYTSGNQTIAGTKTFSSTISGSINGNAATATTATNATNFNVAADNTTNSSHYITFTGGASGNQRPNSDTTLRYNPSTNTLSSTNFSGALSGNASTATTATNVNRQVIAGNGLTGGGTMTADRTVAVGAGTGITVNANDVRVNSDQRSNIEYIGPNADDYLRIDGTNNRATFNFAGAQRMRLFSTGELHADGDVVAFSTSISDQRFKDQVTPVTNATETCKKLQGVEYTWNATGRKGTRDMGFIAQAVEEVLPNIVHTKHLEIGEWSDAPMDAKTIDYEKLTAVLVEAVKELSARIDALESSQ